MMTAQEVIIISELIKLGLIPDDGIFQITNSILEKFIHLYGNLFSKHGSGSDELSNRNYKFARKLAGLTLLKLNFSRGASFNKMDSGIVYMIVNEAFPNHVKIGMTIDLTARLASYQTYDPLKRFKILKYQFVINRCLSEKKLLAHPLIYNETGEWVLKQNAEMVFSKIIDSEIIKHRKS